MGCPLKTILDYLPQLEKALDLAGNTHTVEDVGKVLLAGGAQLWLNEGAMVVTEVIEYPQKKVLQIWIAAGELDAVKDLGPEIYEWGRAQGCSRARMVGRKGWLKNLQDQGWQEGLVEMTKEL